ncbi:MAG: beta-L-arabinofuranosidase domain-containing protein [Planctomycetota bacterium]
MLLAALTLLVLPQSPPALAPLPLRDVHLDGWLGARVEANRTQWLARVDLAPRLEPFEHRPAKQAWAGEHLGKWLHAASLAWANSGDAALRERLDHAASALIATQEADGYLGAYLPARRFQLLPGADWDVWTIKYALLGLLEHHAWTGEPKSLAAVRAAADLLLATFAPGQRSIVTAGTHVGMAATSVLEPIVALYVATRDDRYLAFARRIVAAWDEPSGPRVAAALHEHGRVARTANGKAYELLSNLVGLCALHRATGDATLLAPVLAAWQDIIDNELQPTGSMSAHEHFTGGGRLPASPRANLGETCVTVTWLQLNLHLLQITGEARFGQEIERTAYNHLAAAQRPDGASWCYYTPLRGTKPYDAGITCCSSSRPRGMALLPQAAVLVGADGALAVNLLDAAHGTATLGGRRVAFELASELPRSGTVTLSFTGELPATFAVRLRVSAWATNALLRVGKDERQVANAGWCEVPAREWHAGDRIELAVRCRHLALHDRHDDQRVALQWGPCVLALPTPTPDEERARYYLGPMRQVLPGLPLRVQCQLMHGFRAVVRELVAFADAGAADDAYRVWLTGSTPERSHPVTQARSRAGNVVGSIVDGDRDTFVVTWDGKAAEADWYAVTLVQPQAITAVHFAHGHAFHDGGWFDASRSRPVVQVREQPGADWRTIGELADYPATTATDAAGLADGQCFVLRLAAPVTAAEIRVLGKPAHGDRADQAFSSCAELWAAR